MNKNPRYQLIKKKVAELSQREKLLLVVTGFILVVGALDFFVVQPVSDARNAAQVQIDNLRTQQTNFDQQLVELTQQIANDPAMQAEREIEGLDNAILENEARLRTFTDTLVAPQEMAAMLKDILDSQQNLQLIELTNLPVAPILAEEENESNQEIGLFRHPVRLIFEGNYNDTLQYLAKLEGMKNRFYWNRFDYQVKDYPIARVSLNIYTLSTQQWWLGDIKNP